jgi:hypothetical protein
MQEKWGWGVSGIVGKMGEPAVVRGGGESRRWCVGGEVVMGWCGCGVWRCLGGGETKMGRKEVYGTWWKG